MSVAGATLPHVVHPAALARLRKIAYFAIVRSRGATEMEVSGGDSVAIAAQCARLLLQLRDSTGETQRQLARRIGMTESMISRLERGDHVPNVTTLCRIAQAFGRRLEIVFHEHEHSHSDGTQHVHGHSHVDAEHRHKHD